MTKEFIPAAKLESITFLYDPFVKFFFKKAYKKMVLAISPKPNQNILDIGCGPGNLIIALKKFEPSIHVTGIDIDIKILKVAEKKLKKENIQAQIVQASATHLPLTDNFDIVTSTLMFHHLDRGQKIKMLHEVMRILKTNGRFFLYDFGPPKTSFGKILAQIYKKVEPLIDDGMAGKYYSLLTDAGFKNIKTVLHSRLFELIEANKE